jgi:ketosteroid isomerase-like protein
VANDEVTRKLKSMDNLDFKGWNGADWHGLFAHYHTDDVLVVVNGQPLTKGTKEHIGAMKAFVEATGGTPTKVESHPISFGSGEWRCVVGEFESGGRMVTVAKWRDGAIAEEYIWM